MHRYANSWLIPLALALLPLRLLAAEPAPVRILIWDERQPEQKHAYDGGFLGDYLARELSRLPGLKVASVGIDDPEQGLSQANLEQADVLLWWAHVRHGEISRETARRVVDRIVSGKLAFIPIHSALSSRPFIEAMRERSLQDALHDSLRAGPPPGTLRFEITDPGPEAVRKRGTPLTPSCDVIPPRAPGGETIVRLTWPACSIGAWREDGKPSHVTVLAPDHPIMAGLPARFDLPQTEMYDEPFQVPHPDLVLFQEDWDAGESFRGGCLWRLGKGHVFYFRPGHESYPVFKQQTALKILENAIRWLADQQLSLNSQGGHRS
jgi:trehalose utilization protein